MANALRLEKYSFGVGDRFAHQAKAQLQACMRAAAAGVEVAPVWNKSYREHSIVGSQPASVLAAARAAVSELDWTKPYHLDADHIRLETVDSFIEPCDFYTLDVADAIGQPAAAEDVKAFVERHPELVGRIEIPGIEQPFETDARRDRAHRQQVPRRRAGGGPPLPPHRRREGRGQVHHRSLDGRDRHAADAARAAGHPRRHRRRGHPGADHRAEVHGPLQQGRRLRRRCRAVREGVQRRPRRHRPRRQRVRPARQPQALRPLRQRQVLHLRADPPRLATHRRRHPRQDRRHQLARRVDRPRRVGRRGPQDGEGDLRQGARRHRRALARPTRPSSTSTARSSPRRKR